MPFCPSCGKEIKEADRYCPNCSQPLFPAGQPQQPRTPQYAAPPPPMGSYEASRKRATAGFIVSLIAAIIILANAVLISTAWGLLAGLVGEMFDLAGGFLFVWAAVGVIFGIIVLVGAIMIYMPGKETAGGILVIIFSLLSIVIGGGFLIGLLLGIIGGALGLAKK